MCTESCPPSCVCTSSRLIPPHSSPFLSFLSFLLLLPQVCRGARFRQRVCAGGRFKQRYHCLCVASAVHDAPAREGESVVRRVGLQRVSRCIWRLRFHIRRGHGHHCVGRRGVTLHLRGELCDYTPSRRPTACLSKENRTIIFVHTCERYESTYSSSSNSFPASYATLNASTTFLLSIRCPVLQRPSFQVLVTTHLDEPRCRALKRPSQLLDKAQ